MVENTKLLQVLSLLTVFPTLPFPHICRNIMVIPKDDIAILLKLVSLFFLTHFFISHIGLMFSPLLSILLIACQPSLLTSFPPSRKYLVIYPIIPNFECLDVYATHDFHTCVFPWLLFNTECISFP